MRPTGTAIRLAALALGVAFALQPLGAQSGGGGQGGGSGSGDGAPGGGGTGTTPTPSPGRTTPSPGQPTPSQLGQASQQSIDRPWFFSGKVVLEDGSPPPPGLIIESVCGSVRRPEANADSRGRFSFQFGHNAAMLPDASIPSGGFDSLGSSFSVGANRGSDMLPSAGMAPRLTGCELRAVLAGYRSEAVDLTGRRFMDNPDVGTIILHRLGQDMGTTVSATNLAAPKDAKKAYERGMASLKKQQWPEAQTYLERAVQVYPKYAAAWFGLGLVHQRQSHGEEARRAFTQALGADPKYLQPYLPLAMISIEERKWQEAADLTATLLRLGPTEYAPVLMLNAIANTSLHNLDAAEKSARAAVQFDPNHRFPRAEYVLGVVLANRQDYAAATQLMRAFLERQPGAPDAEVVRNQITEIEKVAGARQPAGAQPRP